MSVKIQMQEAKRLIQERQYNEARSILVAIDHPLAETWLGKIDQIQPPTRSQKQVARAQNDDLPADWTPARDPMNTLGTFGMMVGVLTTVGLGFLRRQMDVTSSSEVFAAIFIFAGLYSVAIALGTLPTVINWRRLGRPKWMVDTFLLLVLTTVLMLVVIVGAHYLIERNMVIPGTVAFVGALAAVGLTVGLCYALAWLQGGAYSEWQSGSASVLRRYVYPFGKAQLIAGGVMVGFISLAAILLVSGLVFTTYQDETLSFTYSRLWSEVTQGCDTTDDQECVFGIYRGYRNNNYFLNFTIYRFAEGYWQSAEAIQEERMQEYFDRNDGSVMMDAYASTLDGAPAQVMDMVHVTDSCSVLVRRVYVIVQGTPYQFSLLACRADWEDFEPQLENILNTVDFAAL